MDHETQRRLDALEDRLTALTAVVQHTFQKVHTPGLERRAVRETLCNMVESLYDEPMLQGRPANHERLQRMLALVENVTAG